MESVTRKLRGDLLGSSTYDPPLEEFLSKQPAVKLPILLDEARRITVKQSSHQAIAYFHKLSLLFPRRSSSQ